MDRADRLPPPTTHRFAQRRWAVPLPREGDSLPLAERLRSDATPLANHLRDAIQLNRARRPVYRRRGGWRADILSRVLVASERMLLAPARWLDAQAARHPVPILAAEVADMADAPAADRPLPPPESTSHGPSSPTPPRASRLPPGDRASDGASQSRGEGPAPRSTASLPAKPTSRLRLYVRAARQSPGRGDLADTARALAGLVHALRQSERDDNRHRALAVHVAESAGWMAERGAIYACQTDGATLALSRRLVRGHLALLPFAHVLDRLAAPVHRRGAGLFVNDLPPIPFPSQDARHE